jgi:Fe-S-cluster containining protein
MKGRKTGKKKDSCGDCHSCCEFFLITLTDVPDDAIAFFRTWGVIVESQGTSSLLKIYSPCRYFTGEGCSIYEHRPQYCRDYSCDELASQRSEKV